MNRILKKLYNLGLDRGLAYVALGNITYSVISTILWIYLAWQLTAADYGEINYLIAVASILTTVSLLGFETTLVSYLAKGYLKMETESSILIAISVIFVSIVLFLFTGSLSVIALIISMVFFSWVVADALGKQQFKKYMLLMSVQRILSLAIIPILYPVLGVDGIIYGFTISYLVFCSNYFRTVKNLDFSISSIIQIKKFFFHSYMISIAKTLPLFADKIIILPLFDVLTVGYYQFGAQISSISTIIPIVLYSYLLPKEAEGKNRNLQNTKKLGVASSVGITSILFFSIPYIIPLFFPRFEPAIISAQIIILSGVPFSLSAIYNSSFMANGRSLPVVIGTVIFLSSQFLLIIILGNFYSLTGLSSATVIAATLQCIFLYGTNKVGIIK